MFATITLRTRRSRAALAAFLCAAGLPIAAVATAPEAAAVSPTAPTAYVVNTSSVSPVDTSTGAVGAAIAVPQGSIKAAITPDGSTLYVVSGIPSNVVTPIDTATNTAGTPIPVPANPNSLAISPDGSTVLVGNGADGVTSGGVTRITTATNTADTTRFQSPISPRGIAIAPDGTYAYATMSNGTIYVMNVATNALYATFAAGSASPHDIAITPDGSLAFVTDFGNKVTPINLATTTAGTPITAAGNPRSVAITPDGTTAFVATSSGGTVPIAIATGTAGSSIPTSGFDSIAITPDGHTAYVTDAATDAIQPIDVPTKTVGSPIAVGTAPQGIAISPDQAPVAHVTVTPGSPGTSTSFDASASTVKYGTITAYDWNFGDGATQTTPSPTTTHTYSTGGNYPVSVTETDSAGTSTARVFTGQTMHRNGGPQAVATTTASIPGPAAWTAYVVNNLDNTVTPINLRTNVAGPAIPVGAGPSAVAITPDAKTAYVANGDPSSNSVTPINTATNTPGPAIHVGSQPSAIAITPDGATAWVANTGDGTVTPIDTATNTAGAPLTIPLGVSDVVVSPDGATLYAIGDPNVTPIALATNTLGPQFGNVGNLRLRAAITPDGSHLLTPNGNNFVTDLDTTTKSQITDFVINALPGDVTITPNGATAYVAYTTSGGGGVVPIDIATDAAGTKINMGKASLGAAITPDGKTAIVTNLFDHSVTLVSTVTNTVGATIQVGTNPFAVAVTPDIAPVARLHVDRAALGQPATLDASASTTRFGTIISYAWDFGDGTTATTTSPITQHVYNEASDTASVTVTNSAGTSTKKTFTGRTVSNSGGSSATALALGSLAASGPSVSSVLPASGPTAGGTHVTIKGANLGAVTNVEFNGIPATFTHVSSTSLRATTPAVGSPQIADVIVTSAAGSSAATPADRFTFTNATPAASCSSSLCVVTVRLPATPVVAYGTMNGSCSGCTVTINGGIGALGGACGARQQTVTTFGSSAPSSAASAMLAAIADPNLGSTVVCAQPEALGQAAARAGAFAISAAAAAPKTVRLIPCSPQHKAPCVLKKAAANGTVTTRIKLPANQKYKVEVAPVAPTVSGLTPTSAAVGGYLRIDGMNLLNVSAVVIGGVQTPILLQGNRGLLVRILDGTQSGPISLVTSSGVVLTTQRVTITP